MSAQDVIARLDRVHQTAPNRWRSCCPAHESKHRSQTLAIQETADGTVLLKCFAGCGAVDIVSALGMEMRDLFAANDQQERRYAQCRSRVPATDALALIDHEVIVASLILSDVLQARTFDDQQFARLLQAQERISDARNHAAPARAKAVA